MRIQSESDSWVAVSQLGTDGRDACASVDQRRRDAMPERMEARRPAIELGSLGGTARAAKTTREQRRAWARMGGLARARRHGADELSRWARLGGRPKLQQAGDNYEASSDLRKG